METDNATVAVPAAEKVGEKNEDTTDVLDSDEECPMTPPSGGRFPEGTHISKRENGVPIFHTTALHEFRIAKLKKEKESDIRASAVKGVPGAFVLRNFLDKDECATIIKQTEVHFGYGEALVSTATGMVSMKDVRNNQRLVWQLEDKSPFLEILYRRVRPFLPRNGKSLSPCDPAHGDRATLSKLFKNEKLHDMFTHEPCGLNERLRFYKYEEGQRFAWHYDGAYHRNDTDESSQLTFIIYLNDRFSGGETSFLSTKVLPEPGMALLFYHGSHPLSPLHEGSTLFGTTPKYALRTDVMFRAPSPDDAKSGGGGVRALKRGGAHYPRQ